MRKKEHHHLTSQSVPHCLKSEEELSYADVLVAMGVRRKQDSRFEYDDKSDMIQYSINDPHDHHHHHHQAESDNNAGDNGNDLVMGVSEKMMLHFRHHQDHLKLRRDGWKVLRNPALNPASNPVIIYKDGLKISHLSTNPVNIFWCDVAKKCTLSVITCYPIHSSNPNLQLNSGLPELGHFIRTFAARTNLSHLTVVVSLIYMERLKSHLPNNAHGESGTQHRLFVAASLVASKFLHDISSLSARMVAFACRGLFTLPEISKMELEFLRLIEYQLVVKKEDIDMYLNKHDCLFLSCNRIMVQKAKGAIK